MNWFLYYPAEWIAARWTDGVITINQEDFEVARLLRLRSGDRYMVNGVGVDLSIFSPPHPSERIAFRERYGYIEQDFILIYAARLDKNKHQDILIQVVKILKSRIPNLKLLLAGEGNRKQHYMAMVERFGLEGNVHFLGYRRDIDCLLKAADVAVSASHREGLPVNLMEAMATGLPLVVTSCRGNRDLVINDENGFVIQSNRAKQFAEAVEKLYKRPDLRREFSAKSLEMVGRYSNESVLRELDRIYSNYLPSTQIK